MEEPLWKFYLYRNCIAFMEQFFLYAFVWPQRNKLWAQLSPWITCWCPLSPRLWGQLTLRSALGLSGKPVIKAVYFASTVLVLRRIMQLFTLPHMSCLIGFEHKFEQEQCFWKHFLPFLLSYNLAPSVRNMKSIWNLSLAWNNILFGVQINYRDFILFSF